ncbi:hypothetical protein D3C71_2152710 [compost metagenome]
MKGTFGGALEAVGLGDLGAAPADVDQRGHRQDGPQKGGKRDGGDGAGALQADLSARGAWNEPYMTIWNARLEQGFT